MENKNSARILNLKMATQNIEMNLYNGTDYTVLNPKTSASQVTYSNTNTSSIITGTNTQTAIDQLFQSVSNGKSSIASAITGKGVSTSSSASFSTMATNIRKIQTGVDTSDATAVASNVLSGKTFYGSSGSKITGSMTNRGAVSKTLSAGSSYTIPSGYHNGSGYVSASSLSSQTSATATASDILSGKTAWVNGSKITGTGTQGINGYNNLYIGTVTFYTRNTTDDIPAWEKTINIGFNYTNFFIFSTAYNYSGKVNDGSNGQVVMSISKNKLCTYHTYDAKFFGGVDYTSGNYIPSSREKYIITLNSSTIKVAQIGSYSAGGPYNDQIYIVPGEWTVIAYS